MANRATYHQYENEVIRLCGYGDELVAIGGAFWGADHADEGHRAASYQGVVGDRRRYCEILENCAQALANRPAELKASVLVQARQAVTESTQAAQNHGGIDAAHQAVLTAVGRVVAACCQ